MDPRSSRFPRLSTVWAALKSRWLPGAFALFVVTLPVVTAYVAIDHRAPFYFEMRVVTDRPVDLQVCFDAGTGFHPAACESIPVLPTEEQVVRLDIPVPQIKAVRIVAPRGPLAMTINALSIRRSEKVWARRTQYCSFDLAALKTPDAGTALTLEPGRARLATAGESDAISCELTLPTPMRVMVDWWHVSYRAALAALGWILLWVAAAELVRFSRIGGGGTWARVRVGAGRLSPRTTIWLVALASTILSTYPVLFCGKSFASANFLDGTFQLYNSFPTLPGPPDPEMENGEGTDLGSMAWAHGPYAVVQSRALFRDGELPLWNRHNVDGVPLLGQGQSMFGDPLHFLVIAGGGRAWAWDAKFVLAKLLFTAGVGLLVLAATDCAPAALLLCFSSAFIAFFSYRLNHPGYFSLCYAPWILFVWIRIVRAATWRQAMGWAGGLILANWMELNSGTAKEAYMQLLCLNATGLVLLGAHPRPLAAKLHRLLGLGGAGFIFCLLAAPIFLAFFDTLKKSVSGYDAPHAFQLQPSLFIGLFDDIFYRQMNTTEFKVDPAANFLVLFGTLLALGGFQRLIGNRTFASVCACALVPLALVFGVVPSSLIRATPFLGNILHIDNTFSCVLLIQLFVIAGFGLKHCLTATDPSAWRRDLLASLVIGGFLLAAYFGFLHAAHRSDITFLKPDQQIPVSPFFSWYVPTLVLALLPLPFVLRHLRVRGPGFFSVVLLAGCLFLLHWRHGLQVHTPFFAYTPVLPDRTDWFAPSPTVDYLRADRTTPFRVFGVGANFYYGYAMVADFESISGVDALGSPYVEALENTAGVYSKQAISERNDFRHFAACKPFHDLLNIRYFLTTSGDTELTEPIQGSVPVPGIALAARLDLDVYRNETVWPRAFFVDRLASHHGAAGFVASVVAGDGRPFASVDADDPGSALDPAGRFTGAAADRRIVPASDYRLTNSRTSFTVDAPAPGVVVLTETYYPGDIQAEVDGRSVPVFRVNQAFRGIALAAPGHHRITFAYRPPHLTLALWLAAGGLVLAAAAGWWLRPWRPDPAATSVVEKLARADGLP